MMDVSGRGAAIRRQMWRGIVSHISLVELRDLRGRDEGAVVSTLDEAASPTGSYDDWRTRPISWRPSEMRIAEDTVHYALQHLQRYRAGGQ
jgi:hypothetical protein